MLQRVQLAELPPRPDASPGLLRRRYSVPETIMRKYRVAQQRAECEESEPPSRGSAASLSPAGRGACSPCAAPRFARDRELMRKSALLRRMWGRAPPPCCCCCRADLTPRHARSLDGSHSELRPRSRVGDPPVDLSVSTYRSHVRAASSCIDTITDALTDTDVWRSDERAATPHGEHSSAAVTAEIDSEVGVMAGRRPLSTSSSTNPMTAVHAACDDTHMINRGRLGRRLYASDAPSTCEMLEIVVSEIVDTRDAVDLGPAAPPPTPGLPRAVRANTPRLGANVDDVNIDEYVSSVLVESLNSLSDRLECVTAAAGCDRKISVVEKEIKVKLQSTGVNTIVHLSPTSNNQIIFGNEELCDSVGGAGEGDGGASAKRDGCNNRHDTLNIRDETLHDQHNNNVGSPLTVRSPLTPRSPRSPRSPHSPRTPRSPRSPRSPPDRMRITEFDGGGAGGTGSGQNDNVNRAVLQQIQKLFQDEMHSLDTDGTRSGSTLPAISHIEISDVDVFIDNNTNVAEGEHNTGRSHDTASTHPIGVVGARNYFENADDNVVVPRFSAFPHTDSMEVNTSSSDDAEMVASDCTSLVDSLDDPNSPRSVMLRRSFGAGGRRAELVRSAIDVLDLLPESAAGEHDTPHKDKGEAFFIRIKDNDCECDKENVNVADRMPEKIRQRLYRRHRRRQLRMECARRTKAKQLKRDGDRQRLEESRARRLVERDCVAIISALIDDVITKIAQDEYKVARIKRRSDKPSATKSDETLTKRNRKKDIRSPSEERKPERNAKRVELERDVHETSHVRGKLSLVPRTTLPPDDARPRRLYQKSEIHDGNKCIEILEILEYVNGTHSTPETPSDESPGVHARSGRRSRIPIPVHEKPPKINKTNTRNSSSDERLSPPVPMENNRSLCDANANVSSTDTGRPQRNNPSESAVLTGAAAARRASVPPVNEPRPRSDSLRFRRIFDIIPEERSSVSIDSSPDDIDRRRSSPTLRPPPATRSVATSPLANVESKVDKCLAAAAPPACAGGPLRVKGGEGGARERSRRTRVWPTLARRDEGSREKMERAGRRQGRQARVEDAAPDPYESKGKGVRGIGARAERRINRSKSESRDCRASCLAAPTRSYNGAGLDHNSRRHEREPDCKGSQEESSHGASRPTASPTEGEGSSSSGESGGSLLCPLAPRWLAGQARRRRRRTDHDQPGGWTVTVAGSCRAALPADVEMRLRFPRREPRDSHNTAAPAPAPHAHPTAVHQECQCRRWADCACSAPSERAAVPPPLPAAPTHHHAHLVKPDGKLTLTLKKEARDSSILASKSTRRSTEPLPDLETYKSSRTKTKSSMKAVVSDATGILPALLAARRRVRAHKAE
ncbi:uncharacterized protein LOC115449055 isoform X2 [Manduca sexta]|uniref:uncharacterized protein LOC115449055 isoform X2 n=1 Tax=Manduca sexta TaxID=7130 RepID=UPI001183376D|nr:uncharacterized protein LOC115449055 isoform X2 [Manduca sexta]